MKPLTLQDYKRRIHAVLCHIQDNLDAPLELSDLAQRACLSPCHFHRIFSGLLGETLQAHVRRLRLERAAHALLHTEAGVLELALQAGYESNEAFTRAFRQAYACSPAAFRKRHRSPAAPEQLPARSGIHYDALHRPSARYSVTQPQVSLMNIRILKLPPQRVAFLHHVGPYNEVGPTWDRLLTQLGSEGWLGPQSRMLGVGYDDPRLTPPERQRYDACVTVSEDYQPSGEVKVQTIEGGDFAVLTHHGPYNELQGSYLKLIGQWLPRSGREARNQPTFEVYLTSPDNTEPEEALTDIHLPLKPLSKEHS